MPDILHKVAIKSSPADTYKALTAREHLAGWWTTDTQGTFNAGGVLYTGRVSGNVMEGSASTGGSWKATRAGK